MLLPEASQAPQGAARLDEGRRQGRHQVTFGDYGLKAMEPAWITNRQIEAARVAMTRYMKRGGKVWINIFPDKPVTQKPAETRMGSGKGNPEKWVAVVKPGRIMFEVVRRDRGGRQGGDASRRAQAADQDEVRCPVASRAVRHR